MKKTLMLALLAVSAIGSTAALARDPDLALPRRLQEQEAKEWSERAASKKKKAPPAPAATTENEERKPRATVDMRVNGDMYNDGYSEGYKGGRALYLAQRCNQPKLAVRAQLLAYGIDSMNEDLLGFNSPEIDAYMTGFDDGYAAGFSATRFYAAKSADPCGEISQSK